MTDPSSLTRPIKILRLGLVHYRDTWELQKKLQASLIDGTGEETLILCEHYPVITIGRSGDEKNILLSREALQAKGVEVFSIERGGDVTYHAPGQLVVYPVIDLNLSRRDVGWYMRSLEEVVIRILARTGVRATRISGKTGVWVDPERTGPSSKLRKIASLGVRISRWRTMHGFSLNVANLKEGFSLINPCGFTDIEVTSISEECSNRSVSVDAVRALAEDEFLRVFAFHEAK